MNSNYDEKVFINTHNLQWQESESSGIFQKILARAENQETALIKIEKNAKMQENLENQSVEIFVLEGTYTNEFGKFSQGTYLHLALENPALVTVDDTCIIFRKTNQNQTQENIIIDTKTQPWLQGQGNLTVMVLYGQTALVKWPKQEYFIPHKHWGGEEVFVLDGVFMDEHGKYPKGSWIRSPHLSEHFPYVDEETVIWVKTGHL